MSGERGLSRLQATIVGAAVATALIHLWLYFQFPVLGAPEAIVFLFNGLGYLGLTALLFLPFPALDRYRNILRWVLIVYTLITIFGWVFVGARSTIAYLDKAIEIVLVIGLWLDWQRARV